LKAWQGRSIRNKIVAMSEEKKKCMICGKLVVALKGSICEPCQDRIRREAMGEQAGISDRADRELTKHGVAPTKK
jgi:hypothetical protein